MGFVLKSDQSREPVWRDRFARALPDLAFSCWPGPADAAGVRYLAAWQVPPELGQLLPGLEILFSIGAGVDQLDLHLIPPHIRVVRMIEPALAQGMVEYVAWAVLSHHRKMFRYARDQAAGLWRPSHNRPADAVRVGVMGTGALGGACLRHLASLGYACRSWSRSPSRIDGVQGFAGAGEMDAFLSGCDILVCLLPLTDSTRGILCADLFDRLPRGACVINAGRGGHLVQPDLIAALESGQLDQAVLDVVQPEPLPAGDPVWVHPRICLTPHVASFSQPATGADAVIENIRRHLRGEPLPGEVDRRRGY